MKLVVALCAVSACGTPQARPTEAPDAQAVPDAGDPLQTVFDGVAKAQLQARLDELTGATPVTVSGSTFRITNRWSPGAKANFRAYWKQYFTALGATVSEQTFPIPNLVGETTGHNVEAVLPGKSADSVVIIVHYDSVGITGKETLNPAADDDGSGLAIQMEAARLFAQVPDRAQTVRFVAADYEEISNNLDGDYAYVKYLQAQAQANGFTILVASDDDQTGWSCWDEGLCGAGDPPPNTTFLMISCSGDSHHYDFPQLTAGIAEIATRYSTTTTPYAKCDGSGDTDHYPFWVAGIPAYVIEEYGSDKNPHYDDTGDDTLQHINLDMLTNTAKIQIAYQAKLAGIGQP